MLFINTEETVTLCRVSLHKVKRVKKMSLTNRISIQKSLCNCIAQPRLTIIQKEKTSNAHHGVIPSNENKTHRAKEKYIGRFSDQFPYHSPGIIPINNRVLSMHLTA